MDYDELQNGLLRREKYAPNPPVVVASVHFELGKIRLRRRRRGMLLAAAATILIIAASTLWGLRGAAPDTTPTVSSAHTVASITDTEWTLVKVALNGNLKRFQLNHTYIL